MTSGMMTALGAVGAGMAFVVAGLPAETPVYIKLLLGAVNAGLVAYIGKTHPGTR